MNGSSAPLLLDQPFFLVMVVFLLGLLFFLFLLVRRTYVGFKEGMQRGRD